MIASREYVKDLLLKVLNRLTSYKLNDEIIIGTWIDNKPIYRKVLKLTSSNKTNENTTIYSNFRTNNNVDSITNFYGTIKGSNNRVQSINSPAISNTLGIMTYFTDVGNINEIHSYSFENSCPITLIVEYTKTTD